MKLYLAGPMRGHDQQNLPAATEAARRLRAEGIEIMSPWENEVANGFDFSDPFTVDAPNFVWDIAQILDPTTDGIVLLPGWETSVGANIERDTATTFGKLVVYYAEDGDGCRLDSGAQLVGLMGYAQVGKDTAARVLIEERGFERIAFADALRDVTYAFNPLVHNAEGDVVTLQSFVDHHGWEQAKALGPHWSDHTARKYLQRLGTEAGRNVLGSDIWVRTALAKVRPGGKYVITDVRFPNEAEAIKVAGGQLWRIHRPDFGPVNNHPSETALNDQLADVVIHNNAGVDMLRVMVHAALSGDFADAAIRPAKQGA